MMRELVKLFNGDMLPCAFDTKRIEARIVDTVVQSIQ